MKFSIEEIKNWLKGHGFMWIPERFTEEEILKANTPPLEPEYLSYLEREEYKSYLQLEKIVQSPQVISLEQWRLFNSFFGENGDVLPYRKGESFEGLTQDQINMITNLRALESEYDEIEEEWDKKDKAHAIEVPIEEYEAKLKSMESPAIEHDEYFKINTETH